MLLLLRTSSQGCYDVPHTSLSDAAMFCTFRLKNQQQLNRSTGNNNRFIERKDTPQVKINSYFENRY
jgi:hypothetical protein